MEREEILKKIYRKTTKYYRNNIKLSQEVIDELFCDSKQIFGMNERNTEIFRKTVGINTEKEKRKQIAEQYGIKVQRITQIFQTTIDRMFEKDAKIRISRLNNYEELGHKSIQILRFENRILDFLRKNNYETIKDLLENQDEIKKLCILKGIDYEIINSRIKKLGLKKPEDKQKHVKNIEDINMPPKTYKHLKRNNINTNHDLIVHINELMDNPTIPDETKKIIKKIYDEETDKVEENVTSSLLVEQQAKEQALKKTQEAGALVQQKIDMYLEYIKGHLPEKERKIALEQLRHLLISLQKHNEKINEKEEELRQISNTISTSSEIITKSKR